MRPDRRIGAPGRKAQRVRDRRTGRMKEWRQSSRTGDRENERQKDRERVGGTGRHNKVKDRETRERARDRGTVRTKDKRKTGGRTGDFFFSLVCRAPRSRARPSRGPGPGCGCARPPSSRWPRPPPRASPPRPRPAHPPPGSLTCAHVRQIRHQRPHPAPGQFRRERQVPLGAAQAGHGGILPVRPPTACIQPFLPATNCGALAQPKREGRHSGSRARAAARQLTARLRQGQGGGGAHCKGCGAPPLESGPSASSRFTSRRTHCRSTTSARQPGHHQQ